MKHRTRRARDESVTHPVDVRIGRKIAMLRQQLGISLPSLAAKLRITQRRLQSFENGHASVTASELVAIGTALNVPVFSFFEGEPAPQSGGVSTAEGGRGTEHKAPWSETEELLLAYHAIRDPESRRMLAKVVQKLAAGYGDASERQPVARKRGAAPTRSGSGWLN